MLSYPSLALYLVLGSATLDASNTAPRRLVPPAAVTREIVDMPNNIPQGLLEKADCVIVIASMTKAALSIGRYGRGVMVECRSGKTFHGRRGAPAMYALNLPRAPDVQFGTVSVPVCWHDVARQDLQSWPGRSALAARTSTPQGPLTGS
jgi:hypothetical protein